MPNSRLLAGLIGPTLIAVALAIFLNRSVVPDMIGQVVHNYVLILLIGVLSFVAGVAVVRAHNVWKGWPAVITVFGWLMILGGLLRMWFPSQLAGFAGGLTITSGSVTIAALVALLLGAFLTFKGYGRAR